MAPLVILGDDDEPPPTGDISATMNIDAPDQPSSAFYLARAMMPLTTPADVGALPSVQVNGVEAQLAMGPRPTEDGKVDLVEVIAYVPSGTEQFVVTDGPGTPPPVTIPDPDLSGVKLTCKVANVEARVEAPMIVLNKQTRKSGPLLVTERYWSRWTNGTETLMGVHWYVTRMAGTNVVIVDINASNAVCDPAAGEVSGQITDGQQYTDQDNPTVDGPVYWDDRAIEGLPAGWVVVADVERPSEDLGAADPAYMVAPIGNASRMHKQPQRSGMIRRYAICPAADQAEALELVRMRGLGRMTGQNSYYQIPAWGPMRALCPEAPASFTSGGQSGRAAALAQISGQLAVVEQALSSGEERGGSLIYDDAAQWFHAMANRSGRAAGGQFVDHFAGCQAFSADEMLLYRHSLTMISDRHMVQAWRPDGEALTTHDLVEANGVDPGLMPWNVSGSFSGESNAEVPWLIHPSASSSSYNNHPRLLPHPDGPDGVSERVWNVPDPGRACLYEELIEPDGSQTSGAHYSRFDGQHGSRDMRWIVAVIWGANDELAKDLLQTWAFYRQCGVPQYGNARQFSNNPVGLPQNLEDANEEGGFARRTGWSAVTIAAAHACDYDDVRRAKNRQWAQIFADVAVAQSIPSSTCATSFNASQGSPAANSTASFGPTDLENSWGALPSGSAKVAQSYETMIVAHGFTSVAASMLGAMDPKRAAALRAEVAGWMEYALTVDLQLPGGGFVMQRGAGGRNIPQMFVVHDADGSGDLSGSLVPWAFGQNAFGRPMTANGNQQIFSGVAFAWLCSGGAQLWVDLAHEVYQVFDGDTDLAIERAANGYVGNFGTANGFAHAGLLAILQNTQA